jgi:large subunit ribosomal protein L24
MTNKTLFKIRLQKGDTVTVRSGKYKGKTGKVLATHPKENKVTVEGINVIKKHVKPTQRTPGSIKEITKPIWVSKVGLVDASTKKLGRIAYKHDKDGKKTRIFAKSGKEIK